MFIMYHNLLIDIFTIGPNVIQFVLVSLIFLFHYYVISGNSMYFFYFMNNYRNYYNPRYVIAYTVAFMDMDMGSEKIIYSLVH